MVEALHKIVKKSEQSINRRTYLHEFLLNSLTEAVKYARRDKMALKSTLLMISVSWAEVAKCEKFVQDSISPLLNPAFFPTPTPMGGIVKGSVKSS